MDAAKLKVILDNHSLWLKGQVGEKADLQGADLQDADLQGAKLQGAKLQDANLQGANLPFFQITPIGFPLYGFKKLSNGSIATLLIPAEAKRTASLVGRKCRAEYVIVVEGEGFSKHDGKIQYSVGQTVKPDSYNDDIRIECTNGIHFFMTVEEAEDY